MPAEQSVEITTFVAACDEWWTPTWLIESSRKVLIHIDLDPASDEMANRRVKADRYYTRENNGLVQPWHGRVYLNPPSKRGDPTARPHLWARRLDHLYSTGKVRSAILVVKSVLGYKWYEDLYTKYTVCHLRERPEFVRPDGTIVGRAKKGVSVFMLGNVVPFAQEFRQYGKIVHKDGWQGPRISAGGRVGSG